MQFVFTIPTKIKKPRVKKSPLVYGEAIKDKEDDSWWMKVTVKGLEDFDKDKILCRCTERSFDLWGVLDVFSLRPISKGRYVHHIRTKLDAMLRPGSPLDECTLAENSVFCGHLIYSPETQRYEFDLHKYVGEKKYIGKILEVAVGTSVRKVLIEQNLDPNEYNTSESE